MLFFPIKITSESQIWYNILVCDVFFRVCVWYFIWNLYVKRLFLKIMSTFGFNDVHGIYERIFSMKFHQHGKSNHKRIYWLLFMHMLSFKWAFKHLLFNPGASTCTKDQNFPLIRTTANRKNFSGKGHIKVHSVYCCYDQWRKVILNLWKFLCATFYCSNISEISS